MMDWILLAEAVALAAIGIAGSVGRRRTIQEVDRISRELQAIRNARR